MNKIKNGQKLVFKMLVIKKIRYKNNKESYY